MGSRKFAALVFYSAVIALALNFGLLVVLDSVRWVSSGPYSLVFALFVNFYASVPKVMPRILTCCGLTVSDKSLIYIVGLQLALNAGVHSALPAACGIAAGLVCRAEGLPVRDSAAPRRLARLCARFVLPWFGSSAPPATAAALEARSAVAAAAAASTAESVQRLRAAVAAVGGGVGVGGGPFRGGHPAPLGPEQQQQVASIMREFERQQGLRARSPRAPPPPPPPPPEAAVEQLTAMGFARAEAVSALAAAHNSVEGALNLLVGGPAIVGVDV